MSEQKKKEVFTVEVDGKELKLAVERPSVEKFAEAQKVYNKAFKDAIESGAIIKAKAEKVVREQQLWDDEMQAEYDRVSKKLAEARLRLPKGGMKLDEAKKLAYECKKDEAKLRDMRVGRNSIDASTAESQAENARFNRLVSLCTVYNDTGKQYFANYKDFLERQGEPVALEASNKLAFMLYGLDPNFEKNLPENKFLLQWKMVDDKLRPINAKGQLVDLDGRLINEDGRFINEEGKFVDKDGNLVDEEGNYVVGDAAPFLDENGNPVFPPSADMEEEAEDDDKEETANAA